MIRNLKALGLALVAVLAIGAMAAAGAQAEEPAQLTIASGTGTIDATQEKETGQLTRGGKVVECEKGHFVAHVESNETTITTTEPKFEECTGPLGLPTHVDMGGCDFHFDLTDTGSGYEAIAKLGCTTKGPPHEEHKVKIIVTNSSETSTVCEYQFGEQEGLTTIELTNEPKKAEVTPEDWILAHLNIEGIVSTRTVGGALLCGPENDETGQLIGTWQLKGTDGDVNPTGLTVSEDPTI